MGYDLWIEDAHGGPIADQDRFRLSRMSMEAIGRLLALRGCLVRDESGFPRYPRPATGGPDPDLSSLPLSFVAAHEETRAAYATPLLFGASDPNGQECWHIPSEDCRLVADALSQTTETELRAACKQQDAFWGYLSRGGLIPWESRDTETQVGLLAEDARRFAEFCRRASRCGGVRVL